MNNKQYPTRMHEVLGVEPNEKFRLAEIPKMTCFVDEKGWLLVQWTENNAKVATADYWASAINHGIIRQPRLSEEQVKQLQALVTLGFRWLFFTHATANNSWLYATSNKPTYAELEWDGYVGWFWSGERLRIKGSPLNDLERVCADAPLDIVAALRESGVEVE